jgi:hypothetical protein
MRLLSMALWNFGIDQKNTSTKSSVTIVGFGIFGRLVQGNSRLLAKLRALAAT